MLTPNLRKIHCPTAISNMNLIKLTECFPECKEITLLNYPVIL